MQKGFLTSCFLLRVAPKFILVIIDRYGAWSLLALLEIFCLDDIEPPTISSEPVFSLRDLTDWHHLGQFHWHRSRPMGTNTTMKRIGENAESLCTLTEIGYGSDGPAWASNFTRWLLIHQLHQRNVFFAAGYGVLARTKSTHEGFCRRTNARLSGRLGVSGGAYVE